MIIVTKSDVTDAEIDHIRERIESLGMRTHLSRGERRTIIGCIGDESQHPIFPPVSGPFRKALRITPFAPRCRARRRAPKRG